MPDVIDEKGDCCCMKRMYRAIAAVLCLSLCLGLCGCVQENALQDSTVVPDGTVSAETFSPLLSSISLTFSL